MPTHCDLMETCEACLYSCWYVQAADYTYHCILDLKDLGQKVKRIFSDVSNCTQVPIPLDPNVKLVMVGGGLGIFLVTSLVCCIVFGLFIWKRRQRQSRSRPQGSRNAGESFPLVTMNPIYGKATERSTFDLENSVGGGSSHPHVQGQTMSSFCSPPLLSSQPVKQKKLTVLLPQPPPPSPPLLKLSPPPPPPRKTKFWIRNDNEGVDAISNNSNINENVDFGHGSEQENCTEAKGIQLNWSGVKLHPRDVKSENEVDESGKISPTYDQFYGQDFAQFDEIPL